MSVESLMHEVGDLKAASPSPAHSPTPPRRRALTVGAAGRCDVAPLSVAAFASPFTEAWLHRRLADPTAHSLPLGDLTGFLPQLATSAGPSVSAAAHAQDLDDTGLSASMSMLSFDGAHMEFQRRTRESTAREFHAISDKVLGVLTRVVAEARGLSVTPLQQPQSSTSGRAADVPQAHDLPHATISTALDIEARNAQAAHVSLSVFESLDLLEWLCGASALLWASGAGLRAAARSIAALESVARTGITDAARVKSSAAAAAVAEQIDEVLRAGAAAKASILVRAEMAEYREAYPVPNYITAFAPTANFSLGTTSLAPARRPSLGPSTTSASFSAAAAAHASASRGQPETPRGASGAVSGAVGKVSHGGSNESESFVSVDYALNRIYTVAHDRAAMSGRGAKAEVRHFVDALTAFLADFRLACDLHDESIVCISEVEAALQTGRSFLCAL